MQRTASPRITVQPHDARRRAARTRVIGAALVALLGFGFSPLTRSAHASCATNECWYDATFVGWEHVTLSIEDTWDMMVGTDACTAVITQASCATPLTSVALSAAVTCPNLIGTFTGTFFVPDGLYSAGAIHLSAGPFSFDFAIPASFSGAAPNAVSCLVSDQPAGGIGLTAMTGTLSIGGSPSDDVTATRHCRNGTLDSGEACDGGACCTTSTCQIAPAGALCREALGQCHAQDFCDGSSPTSCPDLDPPDGSPCSDSDACTSGDTCQGGTCQPGPPVVCPLCQTCNTSTGVCADGPRGLSCKADLQDGKSLLQFKKGSPDADQVMFKWSHGEATSTAEFGDPTATDSYALCVFDSSGAVQFRAQVPAGGFCGTKPCWELLGTSGYSYKNPLGTPEGADKVILKSGGSGEAKAQFKGKGANLPSFSLPLSLPARVELQSTNGQCWRATFGSSGVKKNDVTQFKGKN
jgi:hypothetical protein